MQRIRRGEHLPDSDATAHHVGQRHHLADRHRHRNSNAHAAVRSCGTSGGCAAMAGLLGCAMGRARERQRKRRWFEGDHHAHASGIFAEEWRALQRERADDRILRRGERTKRRSVAGCENDRRGFAVSAAIPHSKHTFPKAGRRDRMESRTVHSQVMERGLKPATTDNWNAVLASTIGWTLDSFDYFVVVMVLTEIAKEFGRTNAEVALTITITLAFRPVGAFLFGLMSDKYGRRKPLIIDVIAFSILSIASGLAPNFTTFLIIRALFGIAMGGEWGAGASLVMEKIAPKWRGLLSGVLQQGYTTGNLLASIAYFAIVPHFGWRAVFFVGGLPALLALFIRAKVKESEVWERTHRKDWGQLWVTIRSNLKIFAYL